MAAVPINITVTPVNVNGNDVDCDFAGPNVIGNAPFLPNAGTFDITFQLIPALGVNAFAAQRPFCNQPNRCPRPPGGNAVPPFSVAANTGNTITVHLDPVGRRGVSHFRLNFNGAFNCDPIIIHD
jgi:hypothetical protein